VKLLNRAIIHIMCCRKKQIIGGGGARVITHVFPGAGVVAHVPQRHQLVEPEVVADWGLFGFDAYRQEYF
jgi:hypothetical protein